MVRCRTFTSLGLVAREATNLLEFETPLLKQGHVVVGLDEVGRGALAGPLMVGAVVLSSPLEPPRGLDDSKRLSPAQRDALVAPLRSWAHDDALGSVSAEEIDQWGLRRALAVAANRALSGLVIKPTYALIDGPVNFLRVDSGTSLWGDAALAFADLPASTLVKGDQRSATIAAAAVLAKVARDELMEELVDECRECGWSHNKGYGAPQHLAALRRFGPHTQHRRSWNLPTATAS